MRIPCGNPSPTPPHSAAAKLINILPKQNKTKKILHATPSSSPRPPSPFRPPPFPFPFHPRGPRQLLRPDISPPFLGAGPRFQPPPVSPTAPWTPRLPRGDRIPPASLADFCLDRDWWWIFSPARRARAEDHQPLPPPSSSKLMAAAAAPGAALLLRCC